MSHTLQCSSIYRAGLYAIFYFILLYYRETLLSAVAGRRSVERRRRLAARTRVGMRGETEFIQ